MRTLIKFNDLYKALNATSSRLEKERILSGVKEDEDIKFVLHFLFNPFIVTGISDKRLNKKAEEGTDSSKKKAKKEERGKSDSGVCLLGIENNGGLTGILEYFKQHNTGRDEDVAFLRRCGSELDDELRRLFFEIIKKSITIGANEITLNKIFGTGFIPSFNVMLAEKYAENMDYVDGKRFIITEKLDGVRCLLLFNDLGEPIFFSRAGRAFNDLVEISEDAKLLDKTMVYDGELLFDTKAIERKEGETFCGISSADLYRKTVKVTSSDSEKRNLIFNVFDCLPKTDLLAGRCDIPCEKRKEERLDLPHIKTLPILYIGDIVNTINTICDKYTEMGKEGIMVNIADAPYETKRTKNLLKVKKFNAADVLVLSMEEGTGINKGKLGALTVEFIACDGKRYTCKVGSGFEKEEREKFFREPDLIIGHIIEVGYFEESKNQNNDGYSLRFPTFKCLRDDKTEISMH
ncbi:MAG: hypothetical protein LBH47_03915 [Christensenellaceae bacterium]|jgi:DNA ligase-1|nr:hypothetical protein [Christensenellaceae bacterium]